jgi:hypothetical protein
LRFSRARRRLGAAPLALEQPRPAPSPIVQTAAHGAVRSHPRLFASATATALIVVVAAVTLLAVPGGPASGPGRLNLAAEAYAQTSVASDEILYTFATWTSEHPTSSRAPA